jgi:hypothetical protein
MKGEEGDKNGSLWRDGAQHIYCCVLSAKTPTAESCTCWARFLLCVGERLFPCHPPLKEQRQDGTVRPPVLFPRVNASAEGSKHLL